MGRRRALAAWIGALSAMTFPGLGGQQERPFNAPAGQATPVGIQPGTQAGITFARAVVVFGPSGAVNGIFIYQPGTSPGAGNGPVLSGTESAADPYGNAVQQGWVAYASPGSANWAQLKAGALNFQASATQPALATITSAAAGAMAVSGGSVSVTDSVAEVLIESAQANDGVNRFINLIAEQLQTPPVFLPVGGGTITIQNNLTVTGTLSVNGSTNTGNGNNGGVTSGPSGTVNSFPAAGPNHTHNETHQHPL